MSLNCPKCGKDDTVQKVSAALASMSASQTNLAARLAPPQKPVSPTAPKWIVVQIGLLIGGIFAITTVDTILTLLSRQGIELLGSNHIIEGVALTFILLAIPRFSPLGKSEKGVLVGLFIPVAAIWNFFVVPYYVLYIFFVIGVYFFLINKAKKNFYKVEIPMWENKMNEWNQSFYCHRDETIFSQKSILESVNPW